MPSTLKKKWYTNKAIPINRKKRYNQVAHAYAVNSRARGLGIGSGKGSSIPQSQRRMRQRPRQRHAAGSFPHLTSLKRRSSHQNAERTNVHQQRGDPAGGGDEKYRTAQPTVRQMPRGRWQAVSSIQLGTHPCSDNPQTVAPPRQFPSIGGIGIQHRKHHQKRQIPSKPHGQPRRCETNALAHFMGNF